MSDRQPILICGSKPEIHDRAVNKLGDFEQTLERVKSNPACELAIGLSRYNFFEIGEIVKLWEQLKNRPTSTNVEFALRPLDSIEHRLRKAAEQVYWAQIPHVFVDPDLLPLLGTVEKAAKDRVTTDSNLLRLLGMICDQAFIGPHRLLFDPLYACNLDCIYCNNFSLARRNVPKETVERDPIYKFRGRSIELERFKYFLQEAKALGVEAVSIVGSGEPTLYQHLVEILKFARELGFEQIDISTNGIKFSKDLAKVAVECELSSVTFSITGATKKSFAYFHPDGAKHYRAMLKSIKYLSKLKRKRRAEKPGIIALHVITKKNLDELEVSVKQAKDIGCEKVWFQLIHLREFCKELELDSKDIETLRDEYQKAKKAAERLNIELSWEFEWQLEKLRPGGSWTGPQLQSCPVGWWFTIITCAERVNFCCGWKEVGNIEGRSFTELWNSEQYRTYRHAARHIRWLGDTKFENSKTLMDDFCFYCDNFNFAVEIFSLLEKTDLLKFYAQGEPFDGFRTVITKR